MFSNKFILKFCAISIVSAGEYGVRFLKMIKRRNQKVKRICPLLV